MSMKLKGTQFRRQNITQTQNTAEKQREWEKQRMTSGTFEHKWLCAECFGYFVASVKCRCNNKCGKIGGIDQLFVSLKNHFRESLDLSLEKWFGWFCVRANAIWHISLCVRLLNKTFNCTYGYVTIHKKIYKHHKRKEEKKRNDKWDWIGVRASHTLLWF